MIHSFHLARAGLAPTTRGLLRAPETPGLQHVECMFPMRLGAPILSPTRWRIRQLAIFATWEDETAIDRFLDGTPLGRTLATGWHVRLRFLRRWGFLTGLGDLPATAAETDPDTPVVAVTLARLKLPQVPRFLRWGKPVERLVRDHPGTTLALAATRPLRTICTFTIWKTAREMTEMVHGHSKVRSPDRHAAAMAERKRKDFHHEFVTLRYSCIAEHGEWEGRTAIVPRG